MNSNTRTIINLNTWERAKSYEFYKNFINPQVCITAEVECTAAYEDCKENKKSFFRKYVYAILRSVNDIKELKYRIEVKDGEEQVVLYDKISLLTPVKINSSGEFTVSPFWNVRRKNKHTPQSTVSCCGTVFRVLFCCFCSGEKQLLPRVAFKFG